MLLDILFGLEIGFGFGFVAGALVILVGENVKVRGK